jgi:hypothetical protein
MAGKDWHSVQSRRFSCSATEQLKVGSVPIFLARVVVLVKNLTSSYGWIPHNAGFDFLDIAGANVGVFASLDRF